MSDKQEYEVEFRSATWRTYVVWAKSQDEAEELADEVWKEDIEEDEEDMLNLLPSISQL